MSNTPGRPTLDRFAACFEDLEDPRSGNAALHDFHTLLFIALCTVLCCGQGAVDMALFAEAKEPFLREVLDLKNGPPATIPSAGCSAVWIPISSAPRFSGS